MSLLRDLCGRFVQSNEAYQGNASNMFHYTRRLFPLVIGNSRTVSQNLQPRTVLYYSNHSNDSVNANITLEDNPFYQKYAERINKLKESNPKEYEKRIKALQEKYSQDNSTLSTAYNDDTKTTQELLKSEQRNTIQKGNERKLSSIMKVEKLHDKSAMEIEALWKEYYKSRDAVCAVMTPKQFDILDALASLYPVFVYPIPREDGYEMFVGQYSSSTFHFTTLIQYQKYQENSPIQFSMYHFKDFNDKGVILMSGDIIDNGINVTDAQLLAYQVQYFYRENNFQLVRAFNSDAANFDVNNIIKELDNELLLKAGKLKK